MIEVDGSLGEGGGQIVRSALALSLVSGQPFRIHDIRARRPRPGLLRQHLTAVQAAARIGNARVAGASLGSRVLVFEPGAVRTGHFRFRIGSAGSTTLVLQAVLPALLRIGESVVELEGGTHNPWAPPFEFLAFAYLPLLRRMGADVDARLERHGFHPAGGGQLRARCGRPATLRPLVLPDRGAIRRRQATAVVAGLPRHIAERELAVLRQRLGLQEAETTIHEVAAIGAGNVVFLRIDCEHVSEVFTAFGRRGRRAEEVAADAADQAEAWLATRTSVGPCLADQLLVPLAIAGGGSFRTLPLTEHSRTNMLVVRQFAAVDIEATPAEGAVTVTVRPR